MIATSEPESIEFQSVLKLKGVGPAIAEKLKKLNIYSIQDILFHLPYRYEDRTRIIPIGSLRPGEKAVIEGVIEHSEVRYAGRSKGRSRRSLLVHLSDGTGAVVLRFFHFSTAQQNNLSIKNRIRCFGELRAGKNHLEMAHPEYNHISDNHSAETETSLTPVYPTTEGVHQLLLRKLAIQALDKINTQSLSELLPELISRSFGFSSLADSIRLVHRPAPDESVSQLESAEHSALKRLVFEELLAHQLSFLLLRKRVKKLKSICFKVDDASIKKFKLCFDFELTDAQKRVAHEIRSDMGNESPMLRLLQGDVGSGKTAVSALAAFIATSNKKQVALMVPTEILAWQHYANFKKWFDKVCLCELLTGKDKGKLREEKLASIHSGKIKIIIGTHALFQTDVAFHDLALVIIDEQHRFGVHQRLALKEKNKATVPHQLIMTATPIPRSLAMTAYADLDYSVIDELPAGRKQVTTVVVPAARRQEVMQRIANACQQGEQAYWVCTLVEESEYLQCQAAEETAALLRNDLKTLNIGLVHGRMKQAEKDAVISKFKQGDINLLVATTVIEVGVDVPTATLMVIENAERLGLAQLHQLRGRVGRSTQQSACVLMYQMPISKQAKERLSILRETTSGFVVAEKDLAMRGPGEFMGTRQAGLMQMRIADIVRDSAMLLDVQKAAKLIIRDHPGLVQPLIRRWLGKSDRFGSV